MTRITTLISVAALVATTGCDQNAGSSPGETIEQPRTLEPMVETRATPPAAVEEPTQPIAALKRSTSLAVERIAAARCTRENRCENVGSDGEKYKSVSECEFKTRVDWQAELNAYECPGGIVEKELQECLQAIAKEECKSPIDKLSRIAACRSSDICRAVNEKAVEKRTDHE